MSYKAWGRTDLGNVKKVNEDNYISLVEQGVFVVADGVSGRDAGEVASQTVVNGFRARAGELIKFIGRENPLEDDTHREAVVSALVEVVDEVNSEVFLLGKQPEYVGGMATTMVGLLLCDNAAFVAHVGDSRVYLVRNNKIFRITEDHTYAELLKKQHGQDALPERLNKRYSHVLTRSIGSHPHVDVDVIFFDYYPGDRFLLCTDGLTDYLTGNEILAYMTSNRMEDVVDLMVDEALARGGRDNITAIAIEVDEALEDRTISMPQMDTLKKVDFLADLVLFKDLTTLELLRILRVVYEQKCEPNDVVLAESERSHSIFLIVEGEVEVRRGDQKLAVLGAGDHFGELSMFEDNASTVDVVCSQDTLLLSVPHAHFETMINENPALGNKLLWNMTRQLAQHLTNMNERVKDDE